MQPLTISIALAASTDTGAFTGSWWASAAFAVFFFFSYAFAGFRVDHRWKVRRGIRNAPATDIQETQLRDVFDGTSIAIVDPRKFTVTVARMNGIANTYGYHYIGERGNPFGSTRVAFQRLPAPPPPRTPVFRYFAPFPAAYTPAPAPHPQHRLMTTQQVGAPPQSWDPTAYTSPTRHRTPWIGNHFDGREVVELFGPLENPAYITDIACQRGYIFARSYMPRSNYAKTAPTYCFRRLFPAR